jgi:hypothetical protein
MYSSSFRMDDEVANVKVTALTLPQHLQPKEKLYPKALNNYLLFYILILWRKQQKVLP